MNASPELILLSALFLLALLTVVSVRLRLSDIQKQVQALSSVDAKLDLLLKQVGIKYDPYKNLPRAVIDALQRGEKIQAIKHYRKATGVGLKEAKDYIEGLQRRGGA